MLVKDFKEKINFEATPELRSKFDFNYFHKYYRYKEKILLCDDQYIYTIDAYSGCKKGDKSYRVYSILIKSLAIDDEVKDYIDKKYYKFENYSTLECSKKIDYNKVIDNYMIDNDFCSEEQFDKKLTLIVPKTIKVKYTNSSLKTNIKISSPFYDLILTNTDKEKLYELCGIHKTDKHKTDNDEDCPKKVEKVFLAQLQRFDNSFKVENLYTTTGRNLAKSKYFDFGKMDLRNLEETTSPDFYINKSVFEDVIDNFKSLQIKENYYYKTYVFRLTNGNILIRIYENSCIRNEFERDLINKFIKELYERKKLKSGIMLKYLLD